MKRRRTILVGALALAVAVAVPMIGRAQDRDKDRQQLADGAIDLKAAQDKDTDKDKDGDRDKDKVVGVQELLVEFGRPGTAGGTPANHFIDFLNGTAVNRGGTVVFRVNQGGHGVSVYAVSKNTSREVIRAGLCPTRNTCTAAFIAGDHLIMDGEGNVVVDTGTNPPFARVDDAGRILVGTAAQATDTVAGRFHQGVAANAANGPEQIRIKFSKKGRYLAICMNRNHSINDWMFGLFDVVEPEDEEAQ